MTEFLINFWSNFWSDIFAGVILGGLVALWVSRRQNKTETRQRKWKILQLLREELWLNYHLLNDYVIADNLNTNTNEIFRDTHFKITEI